MDVFCDLHIHTALSPCGDMDMTPNNIVNMSLLKGLDIIAITDHNTTGNCAAVMEAACGKGLVVLPGMELETSEEAHFVCLFPDLETAHRADIWAAEHALPIQNKPEIFGEQVLMDADDNMVGYEPRMLVSALDVSIYDCLPLLRSWGVAVYPAHIDRYSYSIVTSLGTIPPELEFPALEISTRITREQACGSYPQLSEYRVVQASDAHYLEDILEADTPLSLAGKTAADVFRYIVRGD